MCIPNYQDKIAHEPFGTSEGLKIKVENVVRGASWLCHGETAPSCPALHCWTLCPALHKAPALSKPYYSHQPKGDEAGPVLKGSTWWEDNHSWTSVLLSRIL
jgi:hypothetical protein